MKLERFDTEINWYGDKIHIIASDDGEWVKASDAEALKERIAELKLAVERATANMVAAQNRAAELEKALQDVYDEGDCVIMRKIIKRVLEVKV